MFDFIKNKFSSANKDIEIDEQEKTQPQGLFGRLRKGLAKTSAKFQYLTQIFTRGKLIDAKLYTELEEILISADVGSKTTTKLLQQLQKVAQSQKITDAYALRALFKNELLALLAPTTNKPLNLNQAKAPTVVLMVGINGAGKTTTIGKLAKKLTNKGHTVMLAAADTFRAAACEQLIAWGERNFIPVVAQATGADAASVAFDALSSATAKQYDFLIIDTAGRLHTQDNLMQELVKIVRVLKKIDASCPHEVMLVLDGSIGQNSIKQAQKFKEKVAVSGITITKLDGTAKGGIIFALADELQLPIKYIGVGENLEDLQEFSAEQFVNSLLDMDIKDESNIGSQ